MSSGGGRLSIRTRLLLWSVLVDVSLSGAAFLLALELHDVWRDVGWALFARQTTLTYLLGLAALLVSFTVTGLYKLEAYVSRPLHLISLMKGCLGALLVVAAVTFFLREPFVTASRFIVFTVFVAFFVMDALVRIGVLDRLYKADVQRRRAHTVVIGRSLESGVLVSRLKELRGYARVLGLQPKDRRVNGVAAEPQLLAALTDLDPVPRHVFIDAASIGHHATLDLIDAARTRGVEVYIVGRLVGPLDSTRMLLRLFELPVMRVRRDPLAVGQRQPAVKRVFDVVSSAAALMLLSPALAAIALAVKLSSPGPVFYRQQRVGLRGETFDFLKFRSMRTGNDDGVHQEYVTRLIEGEAEAFVVGDEDMEVFKLAEDERVTSVGRFLRKYSLDELPQLWNILKGDMSVVGPRPALDYEVAAYKPWHERRLGATPGLTGLWQVAGRSRVSFDEMVFQDVMYSFNESLLTDLTICLRTVPAVVQGRGAV